MHLVTQQRACHLHYQNMGTPFGARARFQSRRLGALLYKHLQFLHEQPFDYVQPEMFYQNGQFQQEEMFHLYIAELPLMLAH